ncbi:MBL fold metallo-hydrolase [Microbacterium sp. RD1]|uniref:MBL fold metallo-hydrolase n=1 Tax=Microbacterium sp. RD1 TaxID=3457313 RepID=UPI003FA562B4
MAVTDEAPATTSWRVGAFTVTEVQEIPIAVGLLDGLIAQATPDVVLATDWMRPHYATETGQTVWDIHAFVIDDGANVVLVDPGCGNGKSLPLQPSWSDLDTPFLQRLEDAGYQREDVDLILLTHLHLDHIGWCTTKDADGRWVPTFPNARLVIVLEEYEHHLEQRDAPDDHTHDIVFEGSDPSLSRQLKLVWAETIQPMIDAGRVDFVSRNAEVLPGVSYQSTAGHTLGHHSIRIESEGESAFITGDFIHHPMQIAHPDWSSRNDWNVEESARSRRAFFEAAAGTDLLVLGTHFAGRSAGYIVPDGDGYRLVADKPA